MHCNTTSSGARKAAWAKSQCLQGSVHVRLNQNNILFILDYALGTGPNAGHKNEKTPVKIQWRIVVTLP